MLKAMGRRFIFYLKLYGAYLANSIKMRLAYREDFISGFVAGIMQQLVGVLFVATIFVRIPDIRGWTKAEVFFIYGFAQTVLGIFFVFCSNLFEMSDRYIVEGRFDQVLLRPLNSLFQVVTERIYWEEFSVVLVGLSVMSYAVAKLRLDLSLGQYLGAVILIFSAGLILLGIFVILASLTFRFNDRGGVASLMLVLHGFSLYPLTIYAPWLRLVLTLIIPYAFTAFYPAMHFIGRREYQPLAWMTPLVAAAVMSLAIVSWRAGRQAYESTGS